MRKELITVWPLYRMIPSQIKFILNVNGAYNGEERMDSEGGYRRPLHLLTKTTIGVILVATSNTVALQSQ